MLERDWELRKDGPLLRDAVCEFFEEKFGKIRFLEEKTIGKVRADLLAVLPDGLCGIEIKSHSDSYERLAGQVKGYDAICDYCYLCVGSTHIHAEEHVPAHWGIVCMTVRDGVTFEEVRPAQKNPKCAVKKQVTLLWRNELGAILGKEKLPKYAGKTKSFIGTRLCEKLDEPTLKRDLCDCLFERDYTKYRA